MKTKKLLLFVLALAVGIFLRSGRALAATATWTGGGGDTNMSTAANWGGSAPSADDDLVFPATVSDKTVVNDFTADTSFNSITFSGSGSGSYAVTGNAIQLAGGIINSSNINATIELNITLTADQSLSLAGGSNNWVTLGKSDGSKTLNLSSHTLTVAFGSSDATVLLKSVISGTGGITTSGTGSLLLAQESNSFSGSVTLANTGSVIANAPSSFGSGSSNITIPSSVDLVLGFDGTSSPQTISRSLTLNTVSMYIGANLIHGLGSGGAGVCNNSPTLVLSGAITLGADVKVNGCVTLKITGDLSGNHTISPDQGGESAVIIASSNNTSGSQNGTVTASVLTTTYEGSHPGDGIFVSVNNIALVTGTYGDVTISGGILKGTGTVGAVSMESGAIAPGMSPGVLNTGNLSFTGGEYQAEIGGTASGQFDQLNVTGTVDLGTATSLAVSRYNGFKPKAGDVFTIVNNDGSDAVTGTFKNLAEGATFTVDGYVLKVSYKGGDGNDVVLSVVSVPTIPDTGISMLFANPVVTLAGSAAIAIGLLMISRKYATKKVRR